MPRSAFIALGSNTTVATGTGYLYRLVVGGANGATVVARDTVELGVAPNYVTLGQSVPSNLAFIPGLTAAPASFDFGMPFQVGLSVAATSNAPITVIYDALG